MRRWCKKERNRGDSVSKVCACKGWLLTSYRELFNPPEKDGLEWRSGLEAWMEPRAAPMLRDTRAARRWYQGLGAPGLLG